MASDLVLEEIAVHPSTNQLATDSISGYRSNQSLDSVSGYRPKPLNCGSPKLVRPVHNIQENPLAKAYQEWQVLDLGFDIGTRFLSENQKLTLANNRLLSKYQLNYDQLCSFLTEKIDDLLPIDGIFVSAAINYVPETELVYDFPSSHLNYLGYCLEKDKRLLIRSDVGNCVGSLSEGIIVVYGISGGSLFTEASNLVVNCGIAEGITGFLFKGHVYNFNKLSNLGSAMLSFVLNAGSPFLAQPGFPDCRFVSINKEIKHSSPDIIQLPEISKFPELLAYISSLKQTFMDGRSNPDALFSFLRSNSPNSIRNKMANLAPGTGLHKLYGGSEFKSLEAPYES